jgi:hypothetical protein
MFGQTVTSKATYEKDYFSGNSPGLRRKPGSDCEGGRLGFGGGGLGRSGGGNHHWRVDCARAGLLCHAAGVLLSASRNRLSSRASGRLSIRAGGGVSSAGVFVLRARAGRGLWFWVPAILSHLLPAAVLSRLSRALVIARIKTSEPVWLSGRMGFSFFQCHPEWEHGRCISNSADGGSILQIQHIGRISHPSVPAENNSLRILMRLPRERE